MPYDDAGPNDRSEIGGTKDGTGAGHRASSGSADKIILAEKHRYDHEQYISANRPPVAMK